MTAPTWLKRQEFNPGPAGWLVNPHWLARRNLHRALRGLASSLHGRLLDIGCGTRPYASLFAHTQYFGVEIDSTLARQRGGADIYYDGTRLPFASACFDAILCNQVLEHVPDPQRFLRECHRVLKPGGRLLLTVPFVWNEHEAPHDYFRYTRYGLRQLATQSGFGVLGEQRLTSGATAIAQLAAAWLWTALRELPLPLRAALRYPVLPLLLLAGWALSALPRRDDSLYLDHVQLWERSP